MCDKGSMLRLKAHLSRELSLMAPLVLTRKGWEFSNCGAYCRDKQVLQSIESGGDRLHYDDLAVATAITQGTQG